MEKIAFWTTKCATYMIYVSLYRDNYICEMYSIIRV